MNIEEFESLKFGDRIYRVEPYMEGVITNRIFDTVTVFWKDAGPSKPIHISANLDNLSLTKPKKKVKKELTAYSNMQNLTAGVAGGFWSDPLGSDDFPITITYEIEE